MFAFLFPQLDPVAMSFGPLVIRWYALAYLAGFLVGWRYCLYLAKQYPRGPAPALFDDFLTWAVVGVVLGGRIGYILFYNAEDYFAHPVEMLKIWHGGMSFHGGVLGVLGAAWIFTRRHKIGFFALTDVLACAVPIGLGLGRVANFINGELFGRPTDVPWAIVFPRGGDLPRHPSQLYEALLEGAVLFLIMFMVARKEKWRARPGFLSGCFLLFYGLFRFDLEFLREPDQQLGYFAGILTMGQLLCIPMVLYGVYLLLRSERRHGSRRARK